MRRARCRCHDPRLAALAVMVPEDADRLRGSLATVQRRASADWKPMASMLGDPEVARPRRSMRSGSAASSRNTASTVLSHALAALSGEPRPVLRDDALSDARALPGRDRAGSGLPVARRRLHGATASPPGPRIGPVAGACARARGSTDGCPTDEQAARCPARSHHRRGLTQGQRTVGGMEERIDSMLPPVFRPKIVPRSYSRLNST